MKGSQNIYLGLMSGTSLDGLDVVAVKFKDGAQKQFSILRGRTFNYSTALQHGLKNCRDLEGYDLQILENKFSQFSVEAILTFLKESKLKIEDIAAIGHHGHTVFHQPEIGLTHQLLNGAMVAAITKITTVCDFRSVDVSLGGQGAPLVPIGDRDLFEGYDACMNLGGIANISIKKEGHITAFDICPFNLVLNHYAKQLGKPYDENGHFSSEGSPVELITKELNTLEYYSKEPPKSLGIEWVENNILSLIKPKENNYDYKDILASSVAHFIDQITKVLKEHKVQKLLITGGGAYNNDFIKKLRLNNNDIQIDLPSSDLIDFKEAVVFAYLAFLRLQNNINVLSSVTGASKDSSSGAVYF